MNTLLTEIPAPLRVCAFLRCSILSVRSARRPVEQPLRLGPTLHAFPSKPTEPRRAYIMPMTTQYMPWVTAGATSDPVFHRKAL